jgi:hypothetical protein
MAFAHPRFTGLSGLSVLLDRTEATIFDEQILPALRALEEAARSGPNLRLPD